MNVKNKIATFEAQNEERRKHPDSPGASAVSPQSSPYWKGGPHIPSLPLHLPSSFEEPLSPRLQSQDDLTARATSTTSMASANRINRIKEQVGNSHRSPEGEGASRRTARDMEQMKRSYHARRLMGGPLNDTRADARKTTASSPPVSLFSHRKGLHAASSRNSPDAENLHNASSDRSPPFRRVSSRKQNEKARVTHEGQRRSNYQMLRRPLPVPVQQNSSDPDDLLLEDEDDNTSPETHPATSPRNQASTVGRLAKIQRIKKIKGMEHVRRHTQGYRAAPDQASFSESFGEPPSLGSYQQPTSSQAMAPSAEMPDDEEITLTSVRQIVGNKKKASSRGGSRFSKDEFDKIDEHATYRNPDARLWMDHSEEKNSKGDDLAAIVMSRSSSSEFDTDAEQSRGGGAPSNVIYGEQVQHDPSLSVMSSQMTPDVAVFFQQRRQQKASPKPKPPPSRDDDEVTYDYGNRDDDEEDEDDEDDDEEEDSQASLSYEQRRQKEMREREAREAAVAAAKAEMEGPFVQQEDVEHYRKTLDTPMVKTAAGIGVAATLGCILLGPVGLLVGAAAVGIGVGVMQIPEEQRTNLQEKASVAFKKAQESAFTASESLSNSCATSYRDSGIAEHLPADIEAYCTTNDPDPVRAHATAKEILDTSDKTFIQKPNGLNGFSIDKDDRKNPSPARNTNRVGANKREKVACMREGSFVPVGQIYSLEPAAQQRAWLDVLASASTSQLEKMEAMEEIIILAKDKHRARVFLEEGILDSIMWTLSRYFEKLNASPDWAHPKISRDEAAAAKVAAQCCLTLGKAHCAAIHTEGDLLLMSMYERGTVPEERQLAQMIHEVPYHARVTSTLDPTIVVPSQEVFALKQVSLPQAEELARSVKALADGRANIY